ncbi:amino acid adenylation domain-containing protein [Methanobrevibacter sp.]|uniref:amino acid adenylation domain-containing protein n=1 Tax=Methanobrevibacter sp. TaxID=66852 RepID=UPI00388F731B
MCKMKGHDIKFKFDVDLLSKEQLDNLFKKISDELSWRIDENHEIYSKIEDGAIYDYVDVSNKTQSDISEMFDSFFAFGFEDIINVPLYKFLVVKNNSKLTVLAIIHSLIFNHSSINQLTSLFDDSDSPFIDNILQDYRQMNLYLKSDDFKRDSAYWKNYISDANEYVKFFNIKSDKYKNFRIPLKDSAISEFLNESDVSKFEFLTAIFSLYLSRVDRTEGCLLMANVPEETGIDKKTLLKIKYDGKNSFRDYLDRVSFEYSFSLENTKIPIDNYLSEKLSFYAVNDFSNLENASLINGRGDALTINIYRDYIDLVYNESAFSDVYIEHMAENIKSLIFHVMDDFNQCCSDVDILSDNEKNLISEFSKGESIDVDLNKTFAMAFRENSVKYPEIIAVDDGVNQITYSQLESSSNSLAYDLSRNYNLELGDCVGLMLPRNYHFPEIVLALNKIGVAFIPIDTDYPLRRIEHMMTIGQSDCIITTRQLADIFDFDVSVICIEDLKYDLDVDVDIRGNCDDLFSIMFTSGTTGLPKGVMISNRVLTGVGVGMKSLCNSSPGDVTGCYNSFSFGASFRIYIALHYGETCRIYNDEERNDSLMFIDALKNQPLNDLLLPPGLGLSILENPEINLKYMMFTGAKLEYLPEKENGITLVNFFGTTETSYAIAGILDLNKDSIPVGKPIANTWAYILDENKNPVPVGVPGYLHISRNFLTDGYFNRDDLTDKVFIDNPHSDCDDNRKMYYTGDLAFYNFDGEIEIIGRNDDQLSVRGFRIESGEILRIMNGFDAISEICLDVENDTLTAYYTSSDNVDIAEVKNALKSELPAYMIPSLFLELDEIPLNANGKIDKSALKKTSKNNESLEINDEVLLTVVDAFKKILKAESVLVDDGFVALGGNSLSAMQLQLILKEKLDVSLSSNEIIELSTPLNISNHIKLNSNNLAVDDEDLLFEDGCRLSKSQFNIYLDEMVNEMGTGYNNSFKIDFNKDYSCSEIENALKKLFDLHPILKTRVLSGDGEMPICVFDGEPEIIRGCEDDIESFVRPFEFDRNLSRFMIVENNDSVSLCFDIHHLIFDGSSLNVLLNTLFSILNNEDADFTDNGILRQVSFEENLNQQYFSDAQKFFDEMLADRDEVYELMPSVDCDDEFEFINTFKIDNDAVYSFLKNNSLTYNQFFASVFAYTLSRYTGSLKVLFNILVDGRGHIDLSRSVGMFVKTLPILMDCTNQNIDEFLKYSSGLINSVMKYDLYPFQVLANEYDINTNVFFQYSHDIFKNEVTELKHDIQRDFSFFIFNREEDEFGIRILYSEKFSKEFISRFVESYKLILSEMINATSLSEINFTSQSDLTLLDSYNNTESDLRYDDILDAFNSNLLRYPDNPLVAYGENSYTYSECAFFADKIAKSLTGLGVKKQDYVAFLVERSELYLFNILGILSIGAVYVPLDDAHPDDRLQFILEDTEVEVIIASDSTYERAKDLCENQVILNISDVVSQKGTLSNLPAVFGDLACILYTSGTTGVPKGVKITRKSVVNFSQFFIKKYVLSENDIFAQFASIGFDVSMEAIFSSIYAGACVNIIPDDVKLDMDAMNRHFIRYGITYSHLPAQVAKLFIAQNSDIPLKVLCTGGEKLGEIDIDPDYRFVDSYGPTETFIDVTSIDVNSKVDFSSIGHLFDNIKAYVLDDELRRLPVGAIGELYLAGYQVADGYLKRDEETKNSFIENPFEDDENYSVMYRTGDLVRFLPDGSLGIVGRRDRQVKVRGNRLELSEVESIIRSIDIVDDVTVQTFKNGANNELVAYVVISDQLDNFKEYISDYINERKPDYMIPSFIVPLDEIPLNVNGKVDKKALPEVEVDSLKTEYAAPTNEAEKMIVEAFEKVFNQEKIGIHDDFISLGGDSITVIRIISLLQKNNLHLNARDILNYKTPYLIAQYSGDVEEVSYDAVEGELDLLPIQNYFFDQVKEDDYSQEFVLKSNRKLDFNTLQKAFDKLTDHHDMLRAVYRFDEDNNPVQEILPLNSHICDIGEMTFDDDFSQKLNATLLQSKESLDISNKLMDVNLIHHDGCSYVSMVIHHLIVDGVSWNILINDFTDIYISLEEGNDVKLKKPYPYKNWISDVKALGDEISDDEKQYWIEINDSLDEFDIKGPVNRFEFNLDVKYDPDNLLMLSEMEYWILAMSRAYKKTYGEEMTFTNESHGRDESIADLTGTVGWFTSLYPITIDAHAENDNISLVKDVYAVKKAVKNVNHFGLNYTSLIYDFNEFEYKHCPVKFNFLSTEFLFKNELFESLERDLSSDDVDIQKASGDCHGMIFNVYRETASYFIEGNYADETYISDKFNRFIVNLTYELDLIAGFNFEDNDIVCCLSEPQIGVYLDEKINDKDIAYYALITYECGNDYSIGEVKDAICSLIEKHPILKGRIIETDVLPLLICDSNPQIDIFTKNENFDSSELVKPFDLEKSLVRFYIVEKEDGIDINYGMHHIIGDATTKSLIDRDLAIALKGNLDNDIDYGFLYASRDSFEAEFNLKYESAKKFYEEKFAEIDDVQTMETDVNASSGSVILPIRGVRDKVKSFAHENGITVSNFLNAAFAYAYSRFTGDNNVYYTFIENGRHETYAQEAVSMFARTIPILVDCENRPIKDYLIDTSDLILESMSNGIYPFRLIASEFDLKNDVNFEYNYDLNDVSDIGDEIIFSDETDYVSELSCVIYDLDDGYLVNVSYFDKFSQDTIERFVKVFKEVLTQFLECENLSDIEYVSDDDIMLLNSINNTERSLKHDDILDAFNENLSRYPENYLVHYKDVSYTYAEGAYIANEVRDRLAKLGVKSQDNVGFLVDRSEAYMFCVLGILSAGAVYVPLDDAHPDSRIQFILEDTDAKVLIVSDGTYERAKDLAEDCVLVNISDILKHDIGSLDLLPVEYGDLNCILYTSGTTGTPKGVKITRKSILNLSEFYVRKYDLTKDDVYALFASIGFDVAMKAIFPSICAGAPLVIIPSEIKLDMNAMNDYFIRFNVTHTEISTQVAKLFISQIDKTSLKVLTTGGEKLGDGEIDVDYRFIDSYGPSEACVDVTSIDVDEKIDYSSVGYLLDNIKAYILDDEFRRVPVGAVGELYLAGNQIADGYLNREEETVKRFLSNPFDDGNYDVMYRTGDIVRMLPDGTLGYIDRRDSQVKIRGNRVELTEVEAVIREIDLVDDVTVQTIKNGTNNELVAYVVVSGDVDDENLKDVVCDYVGDNKPDYMVPSFVVKLDEIPLNVNGKVDKHKLPEIDLNSLHVEYVAPVTEKEKIIVEVFETVFNQEKVSLFDDFVRLGGDSITAIRVISLLRENDISCTAREILNYKTPYLIAQNVTEEVETVLYDAVEGEVDLLPIQKYFFDQINLDNYFQLFVLKANRELNLDLLQDAFDELTNIHDILRAVYRFDDENNPVQELLPVNTRMCEIKEHRISDGFNELGFSVLRESIYSLDVTKHLMDINLVHYNGESYLFLVFHHLLVDGVSWNILLVDLTYIYFNMGSGKEIKITRPYPYKNWVNDVKRLAENISDEEKQHWIEINKKLDDKEIKGTTSTFLFNVEVNYDVDNLLKLSEEEHLALAIARAYKKTFDRDIIFNRESYGRDESLADVSRTMGWFTSEYPIPIHITNGYDNVSLMKDVYSLKRSFKQVNNLGLNYYSLIYTLEELEYKHCPVTFNFLSSEFVFRNELFESVNFFLSENKMVDSEQKDYDSYGISFNVTRDEGYYIFAGDYAKGTYIGNQFTEFIGNIKSELELIEKYEFEDDDIVCCLSEPQMGIYLDEKVHDKGTAYNSNGILNAGSYSLEEIEDAIYSIISKHPILKGRILDTDEFPLMVCDSYPLIEKVNVEDYSELIKPFNLDEHLARFFIVDNDEGKFVFYDMHHIISDATCDGIISKEFYSALKANLNSDVDYGFVQASNDTFESRFEPDYDSAIEFFKSEFADIDDVQNLLGDVDGCEGTVRLPIHGIRDSVESLTYDMGITVSSLLNAVFAYTYSRFTGGDRVYYNFTEHGRHELYSQNALGMFVRTIPIIVDCKNKPIRDYIGETSDLILESMSNSIYPFRLLASDYGLTNDVIFEYNFDLNDVSDIGDEIIFSDYANKVSEFFCVVNDIDDGYLVSVGHSDKFSQATALRFVKVYKEVLTQFLEKENLSDIDYCCEDDIKLLDEINQTECSLKYEDILDSFNDNLSKCPDSDLVKFKDKVYTFGQGAYVASKIANLLRSLGVEKQDKVAFLTDRCEHYILSVLGILSSGSIYVPLDNAHPDDRLQFILADTGAKVVIVSDDTIKRAQSLTGDSILLNISDILKEEVKSIDSLPVEYGDLSCILYTSGTTGVPKGVKITRKSLLNVAAFYSENYNLSEGDVYGLFSAIGFDVSNFVIGAVLYSGACLSIIPEEIRLDMVEMNNYFIKHGVTHTFITTQVGKLFLETVDETTLDVLLVAGEKLGFVESPPDYELVDAYGPTEAFAFMSSINNSDKIHGSSVGALNYNTKIYVLDNELRCVPRGAVGELYIAGHQLAQGYLNRDDETQNAFIKNPFDDGDYGVMYRTGDVVRLLPDGTIGIVGRRDSQVKVRGNRLELTEVESTIREIDQIRDVTVQTISKNGNNELVAYVAGDFDDDNVKDTVCSYISERKPSYMVPSFVVEMDEIPLNVNGKVDKQKLPKVSSESKDYEPPKTSLEQSIANVFSEVLDIDKPVSRNDEFSSLGGDSIAVIKLITRLRESNIQISVKDVLENQSVKNIAESAEYKISSNNISQESIEGFVDMTPSTLYFANMELKNPSCFNRSVLLETSKRIDEEILEKAMCAVVNHHDMLRSLLKDGKLFVRSQNDENIFTIEHCDMIEFNDKIEQVNNEINISGGPLIKLVVFNDDNCDNLYMCIHQLLVDSDSIRIIVNDLNLAYAQIDKDREVDLYNKTSSYQDYALAIEKYKNDEDVLNQKYYWKNTLSVLHDVEHTEVGPKIRKFDSFSLKLSKQLSSALFTHALKHYSCSSNALFLSMILKSWNEVFDKKSLSVRLDTERANFDENILIDRTVGWLNTSYPVIIDFDGQNDDEIIENVEMTLDEVPNNGFDYPVLMGIERDEIPLIKFNYMGEFNKSNPGKMFNSKYVPELPHLYLGENDVGCDVNINVCTLNNETIINFQFNSERFTREVMDNLGNSFMANMTGAVKSAPADYSDDVKVFSNHPDKKKIFFIHTINFGSEYFYDMAQRLKDDYSVIVIEPYNINHKQNQIASIEDYATKYVEIIKTIQPEGPYYIGGYCFGGDIAQDMAIQLTNQNEIVDKLILFDAYNVEDEDLIDSIVENQILYAREFLKDGVLNPVHENMEDMISYVLASTSAMYNYKPGYFDGDVIYFKSTIQSNEVTTDASDKLDKYLFSRLAGGYEDCLNTEKLIIRDVPVEHDHLINVEALKVVIPELKRFLEGGD